MGGGEGGNGEGGEERAGEGKRKEKNLFSTVSMKSFINGINDGQR